MEPGAASEQEDHVTEHQCQSLIIFLGVLYTCHNFDGIDWEGWEWGAAALAGYSILMYAGYFWIASGFSIIFTLFMQAHCSHIENRRWRAKGRVSGPTSWGEAWTGNWSGEKWMREVEAVDALLREEEK
jgi:hypothetical protein